MEALKTFWNAQPWYIKVLVFVGIPLILAGLCFEGTRNAILSYVENKARNQTDEKVAALETKQEQANHDAAVSEGKLEQLNQDLDKAKQKADSQDPVDFYNSLPKPK